MDEHTPPSYDDQLPDQIEGHRSPRRQSGQRTGTAKYPDRKPDPGSRKAGLITLCFLIPALVFVVTMQQRAVMTATAKAEEKAQQIAPSTTGDMFGMMTQITVKLYHFLAEQPSTKEEDLEKFSSKYMATIEEYASSPHEQIRVAIVAGELYDAAEARARLAGTLLYVIEVQGGLEPEYVEALLEDIRLLQLHYGSSELTDAEWQRLIDHHGWHSELAFTFGMDNDDPLRAGMVGNGLGLTVGLLLFMAGLVAAGLAGFVLLIIGIVRLSMGKMKMQFRPPAVGGSLYLETFTVFLLMFILMMVVTHYVIPNAHPAILRGMHWLVALSIFWPMVRGVSFTDWRKSIGFTAPNGVFREIVSGVAAYLAFLPILFTAAIVVLLLSVLRNFLSQKISGEEPSIVQAPAGNPVFDLVGNADTITLVVLGSLLVLWAPLVEEVMLRGALFRHLRSRFNFILSGLFSAIVFSALHGYDVVMMVPIFALGMMFAFIREWRGSIIGNMVAHAMHNGAVFSIVLLLLWAM